MDRRKFLIGAGSLAAGSAAAMGSGAFTSVEASRNFDVTIADDDQAFLALEASSFPNSKYAYQYGEDLEIDLGGSKDDEGIQKPPHYDSNMGYGVNAQAVTQIDKIFRIANQGTQEVVISVDDSDLEDASDFDKASLDNIITFYTGESPDNDSIEEENSGVVLSPGEGVLVGIEIDLSTYGGASDYGNTLEKIVDGGSYGSLVVKAEKTAQS